MKSAPGGDHCPNTTITLLNNDQAIAAGDHKTLTAVPLNGALKGQHLVKATPRGTPPVTGGATAGRVPFFSAWIATDNSVTVDVGNPYASALVPLGAGADLIIDVIATPTQP